jgi:hypothetical protein
MHGIFGGQSGTETGLYASTSVSTASIIPPILHTQLFMDTNILSDIVPWCISNQSIILTDKQTAWNSNRDLGLVKSF